MSPLRGPTGLAAALVVASFIAVGAIAHAEPAPPASAPSAESPPLGDEPESRTATATAEAARLEAAAARLDALQAEQEASSNRQDDMESMWGTFINMVVMLSVVCLLAYLILGKLMPRVLQIEPPAAPRRLLKVIDRLAIDQKRSVMIVQLGADYFMVGAAEQNITLMSKLDAEQIEQLLAETDPPTPALSRLSELFIRRPAKGN